MMSKAIEEAMTELKFDLIEASSVTEWHDTADVVVIGCGVAGACAAIRLATLAQTSSL